MFSDFETALMSLSQDLNVNELFVIGGSSLYELALNQYREHCKLVIATRLNKEFECDTFIPDLEKNEHFCPLHVSETYSQKDITYDYAFFGNMNLLVSKPELVPTKLMEKYPKHAELQYLEIIDDIIKTGKYKDDRTGTGIFTKFGYQMKYDLN